MVSDAAYNDFTNSFGCWGSGSGFETKFVHALAKLIARAGSVLHAELIVVLYRLGLCFQEELGPIVLFF